MNVRLLKMIDIQDLNDCVNKAATDLIKPLMSIDSDLRSQGLRQNQDVTWDGAVWPGK